MNRSFILIALCLGILVISCSEDDDPGPVIDPPDTYTFERNGNSTVDFSGQRTRILMATELADAMLDFDNATEASLLEMFRNESENGNDVDPFTNPELNDATKSIREKVAASRDLFFTNTVESTEIKNFFENLISVQSNDIFAAENQAASPGAPGQLPDGTSTRWVNEEGLEYNQALSKGLIGALMLDQVVNNYLSASVLDEGTNRADNDNEVLADGKPYTTMEHKWDEAYGYLYALAADPADPNATIGQDDDFLNKYIGRVDNDPDFTGIANEIFNAFKIGRLAIVGKNYAIRDQQANLIRKRLSEIIAIRAVYYLQQAKNELTGNNPEMGTVFHDLSEAYGFIYSLRFTREGTTPQPYFSKLEVLEFLNQLFADGPNGLWDIEPGTLDNISETISNRFGINLEEASD